MYLLDTNVVSEIFFKKKENVHPAVRKWFGQFSAEGGSLFISIVTLIELYNGGLELIARDRNSAFARTIFIKCAEVETHFGSARILPLSKDVIVQWKELAFHNPSFYDKNCLLKKDCKDLFIAAACTTPRPANSPRPSPRCAASKTPSSSRPTAIFPVRWKTPTRFSLT